MGPPLVERPPYFKIVELIVTAAGLHRCHVSGRMWLMAQEGVFPNKFVLLVIAAVVGQECAFHRWLAWPVGEVRSAGDHDRGRRKNELFERTGPARMRNVVWSCAVTLMSSHASLKRNDTRDCPQVRKRGKWLRNGPAVKLVWNHALAQLHQIAHGIVYT